MSYKYFLNGKQAIYDWYLLQPTIFPHFLGAKVSVATSAIPVAWDRLRIK